MQQIRTIKRVIYYDGHSGAGYLLRIELRSVSQAFIALLWHRSIPSQRVNIRFSPCAFCIIDMRDGGYAELAVFYVFHSV